jgi:chromosome partitioning protein
MPRIVAVANQKGGVAKTTTVHSLGTALAERGERVLAIDLDPQACLTWSVGARPADLGQSLHDVLVRQASLDGVVHKAGDVHVVPSTIDLAGAEVHLLSRTGREYQLRRALDPVADGYDVVLIDCPPSLGILTINGLTAATEVLIPLQCEALGHRGVSQLLETIDDVRSYTNESLAVTGAVATMFDGRTRLANDVLAAVADLGLEVVPPPIPKSVKVAEAPSASRSVLEHAPRSKAAGAYRELAANLAARWAAAESVPS